MRDLLPVVPDACLPPLGVDSVWFLRRWSVVRLCRIKDKGWLVALQTKSMNSSHYSVGDVDRHDSKISVDLKSRDRPPHSSMDRRYQFCGQRKEKYRKKKIDGIEIGDDIDWIDSMYSGGSGRAKPANLFWVWYRSR